MLCILLLAALSAVSAISYNLSGTATFVGAENYTYLNYVQGQPVPSDYSNVQLSPLAPTPVGGVTGIAVLPPSVNQSNPYAVQQAAALVLNYTTASTPNYNAVGLNGTGSVDLSVTINRNATNCHQAAFTVTLTPSASYSNLEV
jgi:hypothetical protein